MVSENLIWFSFLRRTLKQSELICYFLVVPSPSSFYTLCQQRPSKQFYKSSQAFSFQCTILHVTQFVH